MLGNPQTSRHLSHERAYSGDSVLEEGGGRSVHQQYIIQDRSLHRPVTLVSTSRIVSGHCQIPSSLEDPFIFTFLLLTSSNTADVTQQQSYHRES